MKLWFLATILFTAEVYAQYTTEFVFIQAASDVVLQAMQRNTGEVFAEINLSYEKKQAYPDISIAYATPEAIKQIKMLWCNHRFFCAETEVIARVLQFSGGWRVRNIPCVFEQRASDEDKYYDIVLEFTPDGRISDMYIALSPLNIYNVPDIVEIQQRQHIWRFLEKFYTAFFLKDIAFLNNMYDNEGFVIGKNPMRNIRRAIERSSFVIRFEKIEIVRHETNFSLYGVTLQQKWKTNIFSEEGWLFLMIDFKNEEAPLIWVKTWQPLEIPRNQIYSLIDFPVR